MFRKKYNKANEYRFMGIYLLRNGFTGSGLYYMEKSMIIRDQARKEEKKWLKAIFS